MILAKTSVAYDFLKKEFQERTVSKEYTALVYGHPKKNSGVIEAEIARVRSTPPRWSASLKGTQNKKRAAITEWRVEKRGVTAEGEAVSVMRMLPKTGRTHQIRVHLKALGYPIVADHIYAPTKLQLLGLLRPALHASRLTIRLPSGVEKTFDAPLPPDMLVALSGIGPIAD
jgi:23S rRNA-/tRNA-specific pseudouridylate synthase